MRKVSKGNGVVERDGEYPATKREAWSKSHVLLELEKNVTMERIRVLELDASPGHGSVIS